MTDSGDGRSNCDIVLHSSTSKNGSIQSPLFPGPYPPRTFCRFEFQGNGRQRVQIKFTEFTLPSSEGDDCEQSDTLSVLMQIKGKYEPVETLCGDTMPKPLMSNGPRMLLEFRGRQSGKGNRGFKADFIFLENFGIISGRQIPDYECSFVYNSSFETSGWFHSPNFPGAYPRNIECNYYFHGRTMERVYIRFTYFDVEGIFPCDEDSSSDSVELSNFNSVDRKFQKYCSKISKGFSVKSDGKFFRVTFRSNDRLDGTGFRASYTFEVEKPTTEIPTLASESLNSSAGLHTLNDLIPYYFAILSLFSIANVFWINGL
ncbi:suppressor of lurcher protein 1-like [Bradysia coprophila]|uniref:suppressor of lurcher protein 1-like n=1 Tax=Bradysia coprophila TaxID=38358 RepID=UPI00187D7067|nr:suppressor of lurcher protein 1-like [Bradysia coprophila]